MNDDWEKPYEDDGLTLGPEDALSLEIQKSKNLKVEKLQLKDTIEKLKAENNALLEANQLLNLKLEPFIKQSNRDNTSNISPTDQISNIRLSFFLIFFNLIALGILIIFLLK